MPKSVASRLTVPITVTPFNIQELKDLVAKSIGGGPPEWPGAMVSHQCASLASPLFLPCPCSSFFIVVDVVIALVLDLDSIIVLDVVLQCIPRSYNPVLHIIIAQLVTMISSPFVYSLSPSVTFMTR